MCTHLLGIIARKLGHDMVVLLAENADEKCYYARFIQYDNYGTDLLELNGKNATVEQLDAAGKLKSNDAMYEELVKLIYKTLDGNGTVSDRKRSLDASMVSEFMIGCMLDGHA